jgi:hypothetical protein
MLDKSKGLVLGPELVSNGNFNTGTGTTGWTTSNSTIQVVGDELELTSVAGGAYSLASTTITTVVGRSYVYAANIRRNQAVGSASITVGGITSSTAVTSLTPTRVQIIFTAAATTTTISLDGINASVGSKYSFSTATVKEIPGNHAVQATFANRPLYGIVPFGGRRNLLLQTEAFNESVWLKENLLTVSPNTALAPDGTMTAETLTSAVATTTTRVNQVLSPLPSGVATASYYVKANGARFLQASWTTSATSQFANFDLQTEAVTAGTYTSATITPASNGYYRITLTSTLASVNGAPFLAMIDSGSAARGSSFTGNGTSGIYIWGAQLELGSTATAYQRVTSQYDVTEAGVQSCSYLFFNGTNNWMETSTITPGTDKAQVFAGARKNSDTTEAVLVEFSTNSNANNGSFQILGPDSNATSTYRFYARGDTASTGYVPTGYAAPISNVLSALFDLAGADRATEVIPRINGLVAQVGAAGSGASGAGNFLAYPLYLGRRNATTNLYFNGNLFSLITRFGPNLDATTINATEYWVGDKTGINIANNTSATIFARDDTAVLDRFNQIIERRA